MKTDDMETDSLKFIEKHIEALENDLDPDMRFQGTEGIRRRFYEKSASGPSEAEGGRKKADIRRKNADIRNVRLKRCSHFIL